MFGPKSLNDGFIKTSLEGGVPRHAHTNIRLNSDWDGARNIILCTHIRTSKKGSPPAGKVVGGPPLPRLKNCARNAMNDVTTCRRKLSDK